jgi:hypothetical protein
MRPLIGHDRIRRRARWSMAVIGWKLALIGYLIRKAVPGHNFRAIGIWRPFVINSG